MQPLGSPPLLRRGDRGKDVSALQQKLNTHGYGLVVDGDFGRQTEQAVVAFQRRSGLVVDGIAGPKTFALLQGEVRGRLLGESDLHQAAAALDVDLCTVRAINEVESRGSGFLTDGRPVILFERHIMRRRLLDYGMPADLLEAEYPELVNKTAGGYLGFEREWGRFEQAADIHLESAIEACSWGLFQIMGMHWRHLKYASAEAFHDAMHVSEGKQLEAFVRFIQADRSLLKALRDHDWRNVARLYNGPAYEKNDYHTRLANAFTRHHTLHEVIA